MISFGKLFSIIFIPLAFILALSFYFNFRISTDNINKELFHFMNEKWVHISALNISDPKSEKTHELLKKATDDTNVRITLIDPYGLVLNDSSIPYADVNKLQNHAQRREFRNANLDEPDYDVRKSKSTNKNTVYYAQKLKDSKDGLVLRIAYDAEYLDNAQNNLFTQSAALAAATLLAIALMAAYLARKFSSPVRNLDAIAKNIEKAQTGYHFPQFDDPTFNKISATIYKIYTNLMSEKIEAENGRKKLGAVLKAMNEGIVLLDKNGNITHMNDLASEYLGVKLTLGQKVGDSGNIDLIIFFKNLIDCQSERTEIKYKDLLFEAYSRKVGEETLTVFAEVTDKLQYEAFKTELIGNLTHEIKTPLAIIMGASETILKDKNMDETVKTKFLETIYKNTTKLNELVNDSLELHRLEYQKNDKDQLEPVNVYEIIEELKPIFQSTGSKEIIYDVPNISVNIRSEHISSILTNLITNAQKYSTGDKIFVEMRKDKKKVIINVADMGPLIPEIERKRIFERFYTVSKSREKKSSGTGLGLAIVKHIVSVYSGKATVYENDKEGNTFEIILKEKI